jgi:hypothetical protein
MPQLNTVKPMRDEIPLTEDSLSKAKRQQAEDRAKVTAETGLKFDADGNPYLPAKVLTMPVGPRRIPWNSQLDCDEAIDIAVETYGLEAVVRALRLVAATNGVDL